MLKLIFVTWIYLLASSSTFEILELGKNPIVLVKHRSCKIQTGTIKLIHPINLHQIEESIELLTTRFYSKLTPTNPLNEIVKFRIRKLYSTLHALKPHRHNRPKRWNQLGTAWKWIAGSPDANDLRIINTTLSELVSQNNKQYRINDNINIRIGQLTQTVNEIANSLNRHNDELDVVQGVTTMLNVDIINELLDNIQEAISFSKIAVINNKMLTTRELNMIRATLEDQGVETIFPEEALQFVTPKIAVKDKDLLYILHVPELENSHSTIIRIFPLIVNDQIIRTYPSHLIRQGSKFYKTSKPDDFVQRSSYIDEFEDDCIRPIILGRQANCISVYSNETTQKLIDENTVLISNAKNHSLESNCGPDNRTITGSYMLKFTNCTLKFNDQKFHNLEIISNHEIIHGAFNNILINWTMQNRYNIAEIGDTAISNRRRLDHVYLEQNDLRVNLWSSVGGISLSTVIYVTIVVLILKGINPCRKFHSRRNQLPTVDPGRLELEEGAVTDAVNQLRIQQQQLAAALAAIKQQQQQQ